MMNTRNYYLAKVSNIFDKAKKTEMLRFYDSELEQSPFRKAGFESDKDVIELELVCDPLYQNFKIDTLMHISV